ncbi:immunity 22 family protein [Listeria booriae]|uniref:immunity 22 family protein n=1 Tax=Listeria booriae TaxID=1552123 RepID=UPI001628B372|nr:immunity 22 family protein [Listeria booriae]MBC1811744.1 immunity 22 family protein [Listeria booriae]MBC1917665.1 immunity 22 family protein [Listeria booriae]MBC1975013.1 immunity 22 family protein [Listeria booriae]MBC2024328.1 immunity 22 family protein [Listeria booriae]MBC2032305.1 immunity 22 family protein [Listeria booriae]
MEKNGIVSLWLGNAENIEQLDNYVELKYDDDGESIPSEFLLDYQIDMDDIDEDFIEKAVLDKKYDSFTSLLKDASYEEKIIPKLLKDYSIENDYNAVILLYNFEYEGKTMVANNFDFIASVSYI